MRDRPRATQIPTVLAPAVGAILLLISSCSESESAGASGNASPTPSRESDSVSGKYTPDIEWMVAAAMERLASEDLSDQAKRNAEEVIRSSYSSAVIMLRADLTYKKTGRVLDVGTAKHEGTWEIENGKLTLHQTHLGGEPFPWTVFGKVIDGVLTIHFGTLQPEPMPWADAQNGAKIQRWLKSK